MNSIMYLDASEDSERISIGFFLCSQQADWLRDYILDFYENLIGRRLTEAKFSDVLNELRLKGSEEVLLKFIEPLRVILSAGEVGAIILPRKFTDLDVQPLNPKLWNFLTSKDVMLRYAEQFGSKRPMRPKKMVILLAFLILDMSPRVAILDKELFSQQLLALLRAVKGPSVKSGESMQHPGLQVADFAAGYFRHVARVFGVKRVLLRFL